MYELLYLTIVVEDLNQEYGEGTVSGNGIKWLKNVTLNIH